MNFYVKLLIFILVNFGALWLGSVLQGEGARSSWYQSLQIAPWTPPGWVFGAAWFSIMLLFSFYMSWASDLKVMDLIMILFIIQLGLNISWNAVFFRYHLIGPALLVIVLLTLVVGALMLASFKELRWKSLLILPYFLWLILATSLNAYTWLKN